MKPAFYCSLALSALLLLVSAPSGHADEFDRMTYFTFSGAVQVPGATLPAGTYQFKLANPAQGHNVGIVLSRSGRIPYAQFFMTPDLHRPAKDDDHSVIVFHETPA